MIINCKIDSNISNSTAGGAYILSDYTSIANTQFSFNEANDYSALFVSSSEFILKNSTLTNNIDNSPHVAPLGFGSGNNKNYLVLNSVIYHPNHPNRDLYINGGNVSLHNNLFYHHNTSGYNGQVPDVDSNNIFSINNPFVDSQNGDYSLVDSSLAIGAGIDSVFFINSTVYSLAYDKLNISRPTPANSNHDIGCLLYTSPSPRD